ncbi:MAG: hypothetical protein HY843_08740 [Bdellovibrio sp.]|nr:hypothetical protein [Bdellovibrio sp.]
MMKSVFKTAALSCLNEHHDGPLKNYYNFLVHKKSRAPFQARHAVARKIAAFTLGTLKSGKEFDFKGKETKLNYKVF